MYSVREDPPKNIQDVLENHDPLTQRLLYARGITTKEEVESFFKKEWNQIQTDGLQDAEKAVRRILQAIAEGEVIGIYGDYDCDGIPAAAALYATINAFGHTKMIYYTPDRNTHGFGINDEGVAKIKRAGATVVCVLDCGTAEPEGIAKFQNDGIDTIIIDHHLPGEKVPEAFALINPALEEGYKEPYPCAAGVVYMVLQKLLEIAQEMPFEKKPVPGWEKWQLDIIALATLSDMVPLRGINRQITHYGLQVLRKSPRPGIRALCRVLKLQQQSITQDDLSFLIIPRINAASRMGDAETAFKLLTTQDMAEAEHLAKTLTNLNNKRKSAVAAMVRKAHKLAEKKDKEKKVWVFGDREWRPSLAGLVAHKLAEEYGKAVFVWGQGGGGEAGTSVKGSCRSITHNTFKIMQEAPELFVECGGHAQAGGFTAVPGAEVILEDALNKTEALQEEGVKKYQVDGECSIGDIPEVLETGRKFAPFGMENEQIHIAIPNCYVEQERMFGKKKEHKSYTFKDATGKIEGVSFFSKENSEERGANTERTVIALAEWDTFRDRPRLRVLKVLS